MTSVSIKELNDLVDHGDWYYHGDNPGLFENLDKVHEIIRLAPWIAVDTETIGLKDDERELIGIGIAITPTDSFYWPAWSPDLHFIKQVMEDKSIIKVFHNVAFDAEVLIDFNPSIVVYPTVDTMQLCQQEGLPKELKEVSKLFDWQIDSIEDILSIFGEDMLSVPTDITAAKCCWDIRATHVLYTILGKSKNYNHNTAMRDAITSRALARAHKRGMPFDQEVALVNKGKFQTQKDAIYHSFRMESDYEFNPGASEQVAFVLTERGHYMLPNWDKKHRAKAAIGELKKVTMKTGEEFLLDLYKIKPDPFILGILAYRDVQIKLSTFINPYIESGTERVHTRFHVQGETQRMHSYWPNMVNVPAWARPQWYFDSGIGTRFDKNQQELRILANFSKDPTMLGIFERYDATGMCDKSLKFHAQTASLVGSNYEDGKTGNFCMVYGGSVSTIATSLGCSSAAAQEFSDRWATAYPVAFRWIEDQKERGREEGIVQTIIGRPMVLPEVGGFSKTHGEIDQGYMERCAVNWPIQASGAEDTKGAINKLDEMGADIRIPIHDEVVLDGEYDLRGIGLDETIPGIRTPIDTSRIERWMKT